MRESFASTLQSTDLRNTYKHVHTHTTQMFCFMKDRMEVCFLPVRDNFSSLITSSVLIDKLAKLSSWFSSV